ncbi:hypothetical protein [Bradyrhizobium sp. CW9]|uniref:hypothetical protein n=1 Tax=Bradyrhizobium sp. CW9 TaxID=2782689 RepID=UPI001FF90034|nr:hypothetical protein [Bradyrhizobium sp. CW9]
MIEIIADVETITKQAILSFVATANEGGTPNLSPKTSLTVTWRSLLLRYRIPGPY